VMEVSIRRIAWQSTRMDADIKMRNLITSATRAGEDILANTKKIKSWRRHAAAC
jgi:hypothetical protein